MPYESRAVHLTGRPDGIPTEDLFQIVEAVAADPGPDEVVVKNEYMSVDPAMRPRLSFEQPINAPMTGGALGSVVASRHPRFKEGDTVMHGSGFREYHVSDGTDLSILEPGEFSPTLYMHALGTTGFTAWGGLLITGALQDGENVFVSAAAGAVGSVAAQIAKIRGCYTIGSAGSEAKCDWLRDELQLDAVINYKEGVLRRTLKAAATQGLDVYFDNVGGEHLDAAIPRMNVRGRVAVCGMISSYNNFGALSAPITTLSNMVYQRIRMEGFVVWDFEDRRQEFLDDMKSWLRSEKMKYKETIFDGIESAAAALIGLFTGENIGKMLVRLA